MSVHGLARRPGGVDLAHQFRVVGEHARIVHHFAQVADIVPGHELLDVVRADLGAGSFEIAADRGHAAGRAEQEIEAYLTAAADHKVNALHAQHVGDLVRIGYYPDGAVTDHDAGILARREHGALDVDMTVDETRHQIGPALAIG